MDRSSGTILVDLDVLLVQDPDAPRALPEAAAGLDRIASFAQPIVIAGSRAAGRALTSDPSRRQAWVRRILDRRRLEVATIAEPPRIPRTAGNSQAVGDEGWPATRTALRADWLLTGDESAVGPARRAGLRVIRIGPRTAGAVERADYEARDLLDAVNHLLLTTTFAPGAGG